VIGERVGKGRALPVRVIAAVLGALLVGAGPLPSLASPPTYLFTDGFESGGFSAWTSVAGGLVAQQAVVRDGAWAARAATSGTATYARAALSSGQTNLYTRLFFQLRSHTTRVGLLDVETAPGVPLVSLALDRKNKLFTINRLTGTQTSSPTPVVVGPGIWHELQLHVLVGGASSQIEVFVDGISDPALAQTLSLGTTPLDGLQIGDPSTSRTFDLVLDGVAVNSSMIGTRAPAAPTAVVATGVYGSRVDLSWNPNKAANVAGYTIYRDGTKIGATDWAHTTFSDKSVQPVTTYHYTLDTVDTASLHSVQTTPLVVTTPPADQTPPTVPANLTVTKAFANQVDLSWTPSTDNQAVDGYQIFRDGSPIGSVGGSATEYFDTSVAASTSYSYTVKAFDPSNNHSGPSTPASTQTPAHDTPSVWWGVATHTEGGMTDMQWLSSLEQETGRKFAVYRRYANWDQPLPTQQQMSLFSKGYIPSTAWTTYVQGPGDLTFADVASGAYDGYIRQQAESIKASGIHMFFTFQHEPEDGQGHGDPPAGPPADYIAAFEHVHDIFDQVGVPNLTWLNTLSLGAFKGAHGMTAAEWTPPSSYFDYVGVDGYVRFPCVTWADRPFMTFKQTFQEAYDFAKSLNKPLFIGEVGIIEQTSCGYPGDPNAKAQWVDDALAQMKAWPDVNAICWSHVKKTFVGKYVLDYHVDSTPQALAAFDRGGNDPYFQRFGAPP
jgi:hypothetical protein